MRYLLALFFPWLTFFTMGKWIQGILCFILQITLFGWIPATIWSFISINNFNAKRNAQYQALENQRHQETLDAIKSLKTTS